MMKAHLLLWDIDGTLISSGGAGEDALREALLNRYGIVDDLSDIEIAGRTDPSIAEDLCRKHRNFGCKPLELLEAYLEFLPKCLQKKGKICPGVQELLKWAHSHHEMHNALLTGNIKRGAYLKLQRYSLDSYFEFGAFGDDHSDRNQLGPVALRRAQEYLKKNFQLEFTWVIGDTPRDIECARVLGCKVIAVATGRYTTNQLEQHQPDIIFSDLSKIQEVIEIFD